MRYIFLFSLIVSSISFGQESRDYTFKYELNGEKFAYSTRAGTWEDAYEKAADACFKNYRGRGKITEERALDIIDTCANPR
ncbi:MAG: hypothetical protein N2578_03160 [Bdellovibrionaceae bacterium]|nr:hypothetical protein [Pseudobdellovibrionaceae bacterium]